MTEEEAKKLKPGEMVLAYVNVQEVLGTEVFLTSEYVHIGNIREKIAPPRRKFRKGDIVRGALIGGVCFAIDDENDETELRISSVEDSDCGYHCKADFLTLLCAVEDRADRKEDA